MKVESEIHELLTRYIDCFNAEDFDAALDYYRLPFTWLFDEKAITVATPEEFVKMMRKTRSGLTAKGLGRSELLSTTVRLLSDHVALAGVIVSRLRSDGREMEKLGGTYLVHRDKTGWRLVAHGAHAINSIVPSVHQ